MQPDHGSMWSYHSALLSQKSGNCRGFVDHTRFVAYRRIPPDSVPIAATTAANKGSIYVLNTDHRVGTIEGCVASVGTTTLVPPTFSLLSTFM